MPLLDSNGTMWDQGIPFATLPPQGISLPVTNNQQAPPVIKIADLVHPDYAAKINDWELWRLCYKGGNEFVEKYLEQFSKNEDPDLFALRKRITPIPAFAKAAINDIKNAIFQRTADIARQGGPLSYQRSCNGDDDGIDLSSGTMNWFIGNKIIPELLVMGKIGVCVDMPPLKGPTLADKGNKHPYLYTYTAENIRCWNPLPNKSFSAILVRNFNQSLDSVTRLPNGIITTYKLFYLDNDGFVNYNIYNAKSELILSQKLNLRKIPFVIFEISDSLLNDVARHQVALLNLESSDVVYSLLANVPFYTEQEDALTRGSHLKQVNGEASDPSCPAPQDDSNRIKFGTINGRIYGKGMDRPEFIAPPTEPLEASINKQAKLKEDIRLLVNLALSNIQPKMASAESKALDQHGLESGLSYIGLELEHGERQLAGIWSLYEGVTDIATVIYPKRYSLKSDEERQKEAERLIKGINDVPSLSYKKSILKQVVMIMVGDKVDNDTLSLILKEIDNAKVIISDPDILINLAKEGLLTHKTASVSLFLPENEFADAEKEHAERLKRIAISQAQKGGIASEIKDPAARGVDDLA